MPEREDEFLDLMQLHEHAPTIPQMALSHDDVQLNTPKRLGRNKGKFRDSNIVFLARDPRDVIVSWYFQINARAPVSREGMKVDSVADFLDNESGGLKTLIEFYNIWAEQRNTPKSFMLMKYEEMRAMPNEALRRLFDFVGCSESISDEAIGKAVDYNTFEKMKERERSGQYDHAAMKKFGSGENAFKTRRGKVGGYTDFLSSDEIKKMNLYIDENLDPFYGY